MSARLPSCDMEGSFFVSGYYPVMSGEIKRAMDRSFSPGEGKLFVN